VGVVSPPDYAAQPAVVSRCWLSGVARPTPIKGCARRRSVTAGGAELGSTTSPEFGRAVDRRWLLGWDLVACGAEVGVLKLLRDS